LYNMNLKDMLDIMMLSLWMHYKFLLNMLYIALSMLIQYLLHIYLLDMMQWLLDLRKMILEDT
jgi:hypothetical protein